MKHTKPMFPHIVDSTMLSAFKSCPQQMYYRYIEHWKSQYLSIDLLAGGAFASALETTREAFYLHGEDSEDAIAKGCIKLLVEYGENDPVTDTPKTYDRMLLGFIYFFDEYPLGADGFEPLRETGRIGVEYSFLEPLGINHPITGDPILFSGRADMIGHYCDGLYLEDDKTTKQLGQYWNDRWKMRGQFTGYSWAVQRGLDMPLEGVVVRGIAFKKQSFECAQVITNRSQYMIDEWYKQTIRDLNRMINMWREGVFDRNWDEACNAFGGCAFQDTCAAENGEEWLESSMERRVWDPTVRKEIPYTEWVAQWEQNA